MKWHIIEVLTMHDRREFVESYGKKLKLTFVAGQAKPFSSAEEAEGWANEYLQAYTYQVVAYAPETNTIC